MKNSVTVTASMVAVEFILYTMSLCAPQWLIYGEGVSQGLFVLCNSYKGFFSCVGFPVWIGAKMRNRATWPQRKYLVMNFYYLQFQEVFLGPFSLTWMFLSASSLFSFLTLFVIRPALSQGKRAITALILNILSAVFCVCALTNFLVSIQVKNPKLLNCLGWSFYICCFTLFYAFMVSVVLGTVRASTDVSPFVVSSSSGPVPATQSNVLRNITCLS